MEKEIRLYTHIDGTNDIPFPSETEQVVLGEFTYSCKRMGGAPTITGNAMHARCLDKEWSYDVYAMFNGERFILRRVPSSSYDNTDSRYSHEIELVGERVILDNVYFYDVVDASSEHDKPVSNSAEFSFHGDVGEFAARLSQSLAYRGVGYSVVVDDGVTSEARTLSFENKTVSEALQEIYDTYGLPYYFVGRVVHVGYTSNAITRTFRYGREESLLSISKENANYKVVTAISGTGSEDNIPYYYPNDYESKEEVEAAGGTWINPSANLMPPIYRESLGKERFYKAENGKYTVPGTSETYVFDNEYTEGRPMEHIAEFPDIKPTITGIKNALGYGIDTFIDFAYDADDSDEVDEEGNYVHPYFFAKLRKLDGDNGFNLFDHAIDEGDMTISMTSGSCGACEWTIGVGEDTRKNLVQVDSDGNLLRDENGNVRCGREGMPKEDPQDRQNDTMNHEVWIALRKDTGTFGVVMPNATSGYRPSAGDTFVILHIDLPKAYILAAEERLRDALIDYMAYNNNEKFNFSIAFSRIFLAENPDILAQLNENARIQIEYDGDYLELYVSSFSYAMSADAPLPEIKVELSDTLTISRNALQTAINDLKSSMFGSGYGGDILKLGLSYFLRKDVNDRTRGKLSSDVGFEVGRYVSGASGAIMFIDKNTGQTTAEMDRLYVRMKAYFETLEIVNVNSVGGKQVISPAGGMKCVAVEDDETKDYYRCYVLTEQDGEKIENRFHEGDQVYSQMFNAKPGVSNKVSNHYWWRLCVGVGDNYIDLSKADCDTGSDIPSVGDIMCHRGNRDDIDRQNFIELSSVDAFSPNITLFQGVDSYSLTGKDVVSYGVDKTTNQAFMNVYGNMYVGSRDGDTYMRYTVENGLEIQGTLGVGTKLGDQTLKDMIESIGSGYNDDTAILKAATLYDMRLLYMYADEPADVILDWWFYDSEPSLSNLPASTWASSDMPTHVGDLYLSASDTAYVFAYDKDSGEFSWVNVSSVTADGFDDDMKATIKQALVNARSSKDTADNHRRIFPQVEDSDLDTMTYDIGDVRLMSDDTGENIYVYRSVVDKDAETPYSPSHWVLNDVFSDTAIINTAYEMAKNANDTANSLSDTVSGMRDFTDEAFADGIITRSERVGVERYLNQIATFRAQVAQSYAEMIGNSLLDGVPKTNLTAGYEAFLTAADELVDTIRSVIEDDEATSSERAAVDAKYTVFNTKYGDFTTYLNAAIKSIEEKLDTDIRGYEYLKKALDESTVVEGGLILTSAVALGYTDDAGDRVTMSGVNGLVTEKGVRTPAFWIGGDMVDIFDYYNSSTGEFEVPEGVRPAMGMDRMDGTGYRANGAFWWDSDGMIHADPLSFFVGENTVGALLASFQVVLKADNKSPDYLIPQVPFQSLNIATTLNLGDYILDPSTDALKLTRSDGTDANFAATGDIVAYSAGDYDLVSPIASASALGMIKVGDNLVISDDGTLSAVASGSGGGGISFTTGTALELTQDNILNVLLGTTGTTACAGNDSRLSDKRANPKALSVSYGSMSSTAGFTYDGSSAATVYVPTSTSHLANGAGYIKDGNGNFTTLSGSGSSSKYLAGNGQFYTVAYSEISGTPDISAMTHGNRDYLDVINQNLSTSGTPVFSGGLITGSTSGLNIKHSSGNSINGCSGTSVANLYLNYTDSSQNVLIDADCNIKAYGDVIAYKAGTSSAPFKYWYPSVNNGVLSWTNSTSTTVPASVTIVGQGTTYGWSDRSLRLGTINAAGSTSWGSYVNLTGQGLTYGWSGTSLRIGKVAAGEGSTSWGSYVDLKGATGDNGIISSIPYFANNSSATTTYTSSAVIRCGYRDITSAIAVGSQANGGNVTVNNVLSLTASIVYSGSSVSSGGTNDWVRGLHVIITRSSTSSNSYAFNIFNDGSKTAPAQSAGVLRIYWTAICSA